MTGLHGRAACAWLRHGDLIHLMAARAPKSAPANDDALSERDELLQLRVEVRLLRAENERLWTELARSRPVMGPATRAELRETEVEAIRAALVRTRGNKRAAAVDLGMPLRTLHRRCAEYGIE